MGKIFSISMKLPFETTGIIISSETLYFRHYYPEDDSVHFSPEIK